VRRLPLLRRHKVQLVLRKSKALLCCCCRRWGLERRRGNDSTRRNHRPSGAATRGGIAGWRGWHG
jgi:hypothetical protein